MDKPVVAAKKPIAVEVESGKTYYWCACGRSQKQPFCDGSHAGTDFTPKAFKAEKDETKYFCQCKHTKNPPFCDGTHAKLDDKQESSTNPTAVSSNKDEPFVAAIHELAKNGLQGHHGEMGAMGVPRHQLPDWDDIQILTAQLANKPLLDDEPVGTNVIIGPKAKRPLELDIPLFVSDMSFGALSLEAKVAMARGAELAGTGICSGEGGMLVEEQEENSRYLYELASAKFGYHEGLLDKIQAFHFKGGQAAKTGTGGHLPGSKVTEKIAEVRCIEPGQDAISPATFTDLSSPEDFRKVADQVREISGGVPIGFKLSANHIEADIDFALAASADYIILDGRGGGTGAAPLLFRDHISIPTIAALARARHHLDKLQRHDVSLVVTGGLRMAPDFIKALALGADAIAVANSAMQAIGCIGARMCNTNMCPAGIATQDPQLRKKLNVQQSAEQLARFFTSSVTLMQVMARACGHTHINQFNLDDLSTWKKPIAELAGINFSGVV